jgi:hypothetical protein
MIEFMFKGIEKVVIEFSIGFVLSLLGYPLLYGRYWYFLVFIQTICSFVSKIFGEGLGGEGFRFDESCVDACFAD